MSDSNDDGVSSMRESDGSLEQTVASSVRVQTRRLMILFGVMYFVQGIAEPTEGLIAQPVRSLLRSWDQDTSQVSLFSALLSLPWSLKPLYGLLSDFVPIRGSRRRNYLLLTSAATVAGLLLLVLFPVPRGAVWLLLAILLVPTVGVAFSDVVVDALMVERGRPLGITGKLQSIQWAAMYGAGMLAAWLGGWLSQHGMQAGGLLLCAAAAVVTFVFTLRWVREERQVVPPHALQTAAIETWTAVRSPAFLATAAFLFLWNFNPFATSVQYVHMTEHLGMSEQFYGTTVAVISAGAIGGSLVYGTYCNRLSMRMLMHLSIAAGILSTLAYWGLQGPKSALAISVVVGFAYLTGSLVQLDLAARSCPPHCAGTLFAILMSISNLGIASSAALGGSLYETWAKLWGEALAFRLLVATGAATTALCWLLVPWITSAFTILTAPASRQAG